MKLDCKEREAHEPRRLGAMTLLNAGVVDKPTGVATATKSGVEPTKKATEKVEPTKKSPRVACEAAMTNKEAGHKYMGNFSTVTGEVNGVRTRVLVDSGATHNYLGG